MLLNGSDVRLGGQGWSETDWNGVFYPRGLRAAGRLASYASAFDFVEIDSTFYAAPPPATVRKWRESVPPTFRFAAKVPQVIIERAAGSYGASAPVEECRRP